jgi:hypothetical protein
MNLQWPDQRKVSDLVNGGHRIESKALGSVLVLKSQKRSSYTSEGKSRGPER